MSKKFLIAWAVTFVLWMIGGFLVHATLLQADYLALPALYRAEADAQQHFPALLLAHVIAAGALVWIYERGMQAKPWLNQGLRFGLATALLAIVPTYMIYYAVQPTPAMLAVKQCLFEGAWMLVLGVFLAWFYRNSKSV